MSDARVVTGGVQYVRRWILVLLMVGASIACGCLLQGAMDSGILSPSMDTDAETHMRVESAPQTALILAAVGGLPATSISLLVMGTARRIDPGRVWARIWIGPALTALGAGMLLLVLFPAALYGTVLFMLVAGFGSAALFEIAGILAIGASRLVDRASGRQR